MATITKPIALDESLNTSETPSRNIADVLAQELSGISTALTTASNTKLHLFNKLWENPSPTSAFSAQTITLASSDYDFLLTIYKQYKGYNTESAVIVEKGKDVFLGLPVSTTVGARTMTRKMGYVSATSYSVEDCSMATGTTAGTTDNDMCIPVIIYGFKKSVDINAIVSSVSTDADKCMMSDGVTSVEQAITALESRPKLIYSSSGSLETTTPDGQLIKTHNTGVTMSNPIVIVNLNQNRFSWEVTTASGTTLNLAFRNVSSANASGAYKVFVFNS